MKCGLSATVIEDNGYNDIIVQFEDGYTVKSNRYSFRKKTIKNPNRSVFSIVGQTNIMNNGMKAEVIEDNGAYDIKVKFSDGYVTSCCRSAFRKGLILNPNVKKGSLLGKSELMHCGMKCKVIEDNGCNDILVEFEDGYIKKSRRQSFKSREISNPQINRHSIKGTTLRMECGMCCTVIEDISSQDITVQFEDGYIAYHRERSAFTKRKISNPNIKSTNIIGTKKMMNCGMMAEVIEDHGSKDITIRFEDGTIKKHQRRDSFNSGYIKNDNIVRGSILGVTETMNCGMEATVTEDYGCENIGAYILVDRKVVNKRPFQVSGLLILYSF